MAMSFLKETRDRNLGDISRGIPVDRANLNWMCFWRTPDAFVNATVHGGFKEISTKLHTLGVMLADRPRRRWAELEKPA